MNRVLCRIETYSRNIEAMRSGRQTAAMTQLTELLESSGAIFNRGHENMDEALHQLHTTGGVFSDVGTESYTGGRDKLFPYSLDSAPDPFVWFATALEEKLAEARTQLLAYHESYEDLAARVATSDTSQGTWASVQEGFQAVQDAADAVERYSWLLSVPGPGIQGYAPLNNFRTQLNAITEYPAFTASLRAYDLISTMDAAARLTQQIQAAAGRDLPSSSQETIRRFSHLLGVLRVVCHFMPMLGSFYESMFDGIPGMIASVRSSVDNYHRRIDSAIQQAREPNIRGVLQPGMTARVSPPAINRDPCAHCGCDVRDCPASRAA